ncbi:MAG TPA: hypothetical protein VJ110_03680 [Candidatus Nanoarchaeia archaeon]|nr:hypothetical protein [Candidatus Nanoarchaeia archaeon]
MKMLRGLQVFDLKNDSESKKYFTALKKIVREKLRIPIMAKGSMRMVDFTKKLSRLDIYPPFETAWTRQEKLILGEFFSGQ